MSKGYCFSCKEERRSGYCIGPPGRSHKLEIVPPCSGCRAKPCDWTDEAGCKRFRHNDAARKRKLEILKSRKDNA